MTFNVISYAEYAPALLLNSAVLYSDLLHYFPSIYLSTSLLPTHFHSLLPTPTYSSDMLLVDLPPQPTQLLNEGYHEPNTKHYLIQSQRCSHTTLFNFIPPHCFLRPLHLMQNPTQCSAARRHSGHLHRHCNLANHTKRGASNYCPMQCSLHSSSTCL